MKSILRTLIEHFHNKIVKMIHSVMRIEDKTMESTTAEYCDERSFVTTFDVEPVIDSNSGTIPKSPRKTKSTLT